MSEQRNSVLDVRVSGRRFAMDDGTQLHAVGELSFSLDEHSFTCIVGPSGCGKTTTLRMILGLDNEYQGSIHQPERERVAAVFQEPRLLPWRTVEQNVRLVLPDAQHAETLESLFDQLGLVEVRNLYPGQLSLGLARRAALARAFVLRPALLILDEPFVSLDDATASRLRALLLKLWRTHRTTTLMVTHNIQEAAMLADRILIFSHRPCRVLAEIALRENRDDRNREYLDDIVSRVTQASVQLNS